MDRHSTSDDDDEEPARFKVTNPSIEEYMEYDPESDSYFAPGTPSVFDVEAWLREFNNLSEEDRRGGLISVDELRAAGALDVPAAWRKSLAEESRYVLPGFADDDEGADSQPDAQVDTECVQPGDELL